MRSGSVDVLCRVDTLGPGVLRVASVSCCMQAFVSSTTPPAAAQPPPCRPSLPQPLAPPHAAHSTPCHDTHWSLLPRPLAAATFPQPTPKAACRPSVYRTGHSRTICRQLPPAEPHRRTLPTTDRVCLCLLPPRAAPPPVTPAATPHSLPAPAAPTPPRHAPRRSRRSTRFHMALSHSNTFCHPGHAWSGRERQRASSSSRMLRVTNAGVENASWHSWYLIQHPTDAGKRVRSGLSDISTAPRDDRGSFAALLLAPPSPSLATSTPTTVDTASPTGMTAARTECAAWRACAPVALTQADLPALPLVSGSSFPPDGAPDAHTRGRTCG